MGKVAEGCHKNTKTQNLTKNNRMVRGFEQFIIIFVSQSKITLLKNHPMKTSVLILLLCLVGCSFLFAQVGINADGTSPNSSAMLDVKSTSKGLLPPRMTSSQRNAVSSPVAGLIVFNTDTKTLDIYTGSSWVQLVPANMNWSCGQNFLDFRDNKSYRTVLIGSQCWFAQNLNVGTRINGSGNQTNDGTIEKYCYNDNESNCDVYGGLYQWNELMNYTSSSNSNPSGRQGICPTGWHVPSDAEWCQMEIFLDATVVCENTGWRGTDAGGKMKETGTTHWLSPNTGATNSSGFTALPGGTRYSGGGFETLALSAAFWSAAESSAASAWYRLLYYSSAQVYRYSSGKTYGFSGRCVKD
jgi:uncharacterized protein (TIGR02145 family)